MRNYFHKLFPALSLQSYEHLEIDSLILHNYTRMMKQLITDSENLTEDEFIEIRFEDLDENAVNIINTIYDRFKLPDFDSDKEYFARYLNAIKKYKKNVYEQSSEDRSLVEKHWKPFIEYWDYDEKQI